MAGFEVATEVRVCHLGTKRKSVDIDSRPIGLSVSEMSKLQAAALLRMPARVRISWEDDRTLKLETDNGQQTRRFSFNRETHRGAPSLQGTSIVEWRRTLPPSNPFGIAFPGGPPPPPGGGLKVVTTNLQGGCLRRNGVPYSARAGVAG